MENLLFTDLEGKPSPSNKALAVDIIDSPEPRRIYVPRGRQSETLRHLIDAGPKGITSLEMGGWAVRLAAYVFKLRTRFALTIETENEPHEGGLHGRYFLRSRCRIVEPSATAEGLANAA